ncbi:hypothetical protein BABINDRAFT_41810 [Babjeviella inositovora NRRL Y-12698]|uniref:Zinc finger ZPR1-type domain-containing protein n=1 Tax=Babjeviella inositovora NRRL Y-12698 TaxID=984486 RepID=A0A1E3QK12_9ASCO|nr:uncharacterized protein BABINDRAFT_41810 [Babjeviella inositovora NRRL Y-12698]ODQ77412.1 hypothetical protein BABINDRAFT_41810 [Babjeviella inositovora NRRL Y-12698]
MSQPEKENLFTSLGDQAQNVDDGLRTTGAYDAMGHPVQEIESLCMYCHETGVTRMLLTSIPYFREVVIMSFECPHCNFKSTDIQPASEIQEKGSRYTLKIESRSDFNRQVIKSETANVRFPELDIEIPPKRGQSTTVEGLLSEMIQDLESDQPVRKSIQPEMHEKIQGVINKIQSYIDCAEGTLPLTVTLDDPAGNSWIEFLPGEASHKWSSHQYNRTDDQNVTLGLLSEDTLAEQRSQAAEDRKARKAALEEEERNPSVVGFVSDQSEIENFENEVQTFHATCSSCFAPCTTHMKPVKIPHFTDVIIMSTSCDGCGYKSNEVKTGGAIPDKGKKITLAVDDPEDLARDILKSETCGLTIPELNLDLTPGTLGGRFTTIEGLLKQVHEELTNRVFQHTSDSMDDETRTRWLTFFNNLQVAMDGGSKFTVIMEDPLAASYIQNVYAPDADPNMEIVEFERTFDQNEDLGLNDMDA